jgi:hypothetical protein
MKSSVIDDNIDDLNKKLFNTSPYDVDVDWGMQ